MNTLPDRYGIEQERLQFLATRDGIEGALVFALRTRNQYRHLFFVRDKNGRKLFVHEKNFRRTFIESYLAFKRFIFNYGDGKL